MGIPDHLICLLRNLYAGQEATVRTGHGTKDWFQIGKGVRQGCILSPCYLTSMQSTSWETLGWKKHKLESRLPGEISITSDMQMTPHYGRKWRGTQKPLDESERGEWKGWLKAHHSENEDHGIRSHHFMGNKMGKQWKQWQTFFFLSSKITANGDCSYEIKRHLFLGRKIMTNLDSILKSRDETLFCQQKSV